MKGKIALAHLALLTAYTEAFTTSDGVLHTEHDAALEHAARTGTQLTAYERDTTSDAWEDVGTVTVSVTDPDVTDPEERYALTDVPDPQPAPVIETVDDNDNDAAGRRTA